MKIYIAGKINGDPDYRAKFANAAVTCKKMGCTVINPAVLPDGLTPGDYIQITLRMLLAADVVTFLPDWNQSLGARIERAVAQYCGMNILEWDEAAEKIKNEEALPFEH